jgi:hypothetical protein
VRPEIGRHYPHDRVEIAVEADFLSNCVRVCAEFAAPETVADNGRFDEAWHGFLLRIDASELSIRAKKREIVSARGQGLNTFRTVASCEVRADRPNGRDVFEDPGAILKILELGLRHSYIADIRCTKIVKNANELSGLTIRKRPKQDRANDAERGNVRADPECQGKNCNGGEARSLGQHPGGIA